MRFFTEDDLWINRIPALDDFHCAKNEINELVIANSELLTNALWWGSSATETWKITSDLDLVFLYPVANSRLIANTLLVEMQKIAHSKNIPLEVMCVPEEIHFDKQRIELSKLKTVIEYFYFENTKIITKSKIYFELFGYSCASTDGFYSELDRCCVDYISHKLDKWMREFSQWSHLSIDEKIKITGKFIGVPAHVMRRRSQSKGYSSISFEENLSVLFPYNENEGVNEIASLYYKIEKHKKDYLDKIDPFIRFKNNQKTAFLQYENFLDWFMVEVMSDVGKFLELSALKL